MDKYKNALIQAAETWSEFISSLGSLVDEKFLEKFEDLIDDEDIVRAAVKGDSMNFAYASERIKNKLLSEK